ncbi:MAG: hypothetical protein KAG94_04485 [Clostridiales bacterium]|nr:hypothetical protein [Clostridiales bacterium]
MKKKILVILLIIILLLSLSSCKIKNKDINEYSWLSINNKLFSNYDTFAGCGLFFHEHNIQPKVDMLIYGSGVRIALSEVVNVNINEKGTISFSGQNFLKKYNQQLKPNNDLEIIFIDRKTIKIYNLIFTLDSNKDILYEMIEKNK